MKKWTIAVVCIVTMLCSTMAFADDSDVKVTLGLKGWYNWWTHSIDYASGTSHSWDNGSSFMIGPSLNLKFGKVFLGATYLQSTKDYEAPDWFSTNDTMKFSRKDLDFTLGVMFTPYIGAFLGYKTIDAPMKYTNSSYPVADLDVGSWKMKGPGIGILGNAPLGRSAAFYGNFAVMRVSQEFDYNTTVVTTGGTVQSFDMTGVSLEFGGAFAFSEHASGNVGFKYQTFSGDDKSSNTHHQTFYGPVFGLNFSF